METALSLIEQRNAASDAVYYKHIDELRQLLHLHEESKQPMMRMLCTCAEWALLVASFEQEYTDTYYRSHSIEQLKWWHEALYSRFLAENYEQSVFNPAFAVSCLGAEVGSLVSVVAYHFYSSILSGRDHKRFLMGAGYKALWCLFHAAEQGQADREYITDLIKTQVMRPTFDEEKVKLLEQYDSAGSVVNQQIITDADLVDLRYLYHYGLPVTENELKAATLLNAYDNATVERLAECIVSSYIRGFEVSKKDYTKKQTVVLVYYAGYERVLRAMTPRLKKYGLQPLFYSVSSTPINKQMHYDHRFDNAVVLTQEHVTEKLKLFSQATSQCADLLSKYSGSIYFDRFGETEFRPIHKDACLKLSQSQQELVQQFSVERKKIINQFSPYIERSFTIIAFPAAQIGPLYEPVFDETMKLNLMDTVQHEAVQQKLVDTLDTASFVEIKGAAGNETNLVIRLHELPQPETTTNFVNCGADVNIPVGEVFTSPLLEGSSGVLHVSECYLENLKFSNLQIHIKDGVVVDYSCSNYATQEENRRFVRENILFPHTSLPIGEFAIGTNTAAYCMAKKYNILRLLPILIVEKMGPHIALGDTCFSWEEDYPIYNPIDGKEIIARDNERSLLRTTDIQKAYTGCHIDITIPYEDLERITAVTKSGDRIDILRNGRFVVEGTEALNEPFDRVENLS
ncbi:MAG: aminopeptidase [Chitinivibrionales bacterium]|nr:aminopeptidase [Chitinivibrionales bacterium]